MPAFFYTLCATMPDMPQAAWPLALAVLALLGVAALIDAFKGRVPDAIIFLGLVLTTGAQGALVDWPFAARHLTIALAAALFFWVINQLWYRFKNHDAIGMGDAKWTMLAVAAFGIPPVIYAWAIGAILGLLWLGAARIAKNRARRVHFAPFLFAGLLAGLYWIRLR